MGVFWETSGLCSSPGALCLWLFSREVNLARADNNRLLPCYQLCLQLVVLSVFAGTVPQHSLWTPGSRKTREKLLQAVQKGCQHPVLSMGQELLGLHGVHLLWGEQVRLSSAEEVMGKRPVTCPSDGVPWREDVWK